MKALLTSLSSTLILSSSLSAITIVSNFSEPSAGALSTSGVFGQEFTVGSTAVDLDSFTVRLLSDGTNGASFLFGQVRNVGDGSVTSFGSTIFSNPTFTDLTFDSGTLSLIPGQTYRAEVARVNGTFPDAEVTSSFGETSPFGITLADFGDTDATNAGNNGIVPTPLFLTLETTQPVPEPSAFAAMSGLAILGFVGARRRIAK